MLRTVAHWLIDHDPDATRRCYAQLPRGTDCGCDQCRNFETALEMAFPAKFRTLAEKLGLDVARPAELCHWCREPSGLYLTGGWYHFVGAILAGQDALQWSNGTGTFHLEQLGAGFELGLTAQLALVREVFSGYRLVQLEFQTRVPWVLAEPEPTTV